MKKTMHTIMAGPRGEVGSRMLLSYCTALYGPHASNSSTGNLILKIVSRGYIISPVPDNMSKCTSGLILTLHMQICRKFENTRCMLFIIIPCILSGTAHACRDAYYPVLARLTSRAIYLTNPILSVAFRDPFNTYST